MSGFDTVLIIIRDVLLPVITVLIILLSIVILIRREFFIRRKKDTKEVSQFNKKIETAKYSHSYRIGYDIAKFDEYHKECLRQSKVSFSYSIAFAVIGFIIIIFSMSKYAKTSYEQWGFLAGAIIDAVSALFFVQANKARKMMLDFFDKLRQDRKLEESLNLCDSIDDPSVKNTLKVKLSLFLSGMGGNYSAIPDIPQIDKSDTGKVE